VRLKCLAPAAAEGRGFKVPLRIRASGSADSCSGFRLGGRLSGGLLRRLGLLRDRLLRLGRRRGSRLQRSSPLWGSVARRGSVLLLGGHASKTHLSFPLLSHLPSLLALPPCVSQIGTHYSNQKTSAGPARLALWNKFCCGHVRFGVCFTRIWFHLHASERHTGCAGPARLAAMGNGDARQWGPRGPTR